MKKLITFLSLALICVCNGCGRFAGTSGTDGSDSTETTQWGTENLCVENPIAPEDTLTYRIEIKLDTLSDGGALARELNGFLRDSVLCMPGASLHQCAAAFADSISTAWKSVLEGLYDPQSEYKDMFRYYYEIKGNAVEDAPEGMLSYQVDVETYEGGAHGSHWVRYGNFDKKTGKQLALQDVVPDEKRQDVLEAMMKKLCADNDVDDVAQLQEQAGITVLGDLYLTNNFRLKGDSIEFLFNQYEIAPYSAGIICITVARP